MRFIVSSNHIAFEEMRWLDLIGKKKYWSSGL